jgi:hypothetical protein
MTSDLRLIRPMLLDYHGGAGQHPQFNCSRSCCLRREQKPLKDQRALPGFAVNPEVGLDQERKSLLEARLDLIVIDVRCKAEVEAVDLDSRLAEFRSNVLEITIRSRRAPRR